MELRPPPSRQFVHARPVTECAQCGERIVAPEWSEYLDDGRVRHLWVCTACDYQFETTVRFPPRRPSGGA
jgi:hypothetical protein